MIDQLRDEIERRIEVLQREADALRGALTALGSSDRDRKTAARRPGSRRASASTTRRTRSTNGAQSRGRGSAGGRGTTASSSVAESSDRSPGAAASTKAAVLSALSSGEAMTASQVAAATGLGRASVSTTLSKMAKSGEVTKADRGYRRTETKQAA